MVKTFVILFEVEMCEYHKDEIPQNIRSALENRGISPSGIDIWEKGKEPVMCSRKEDDNG